jgi:hypothetical protein
LKYLLVGLIVSGAMAWGQSATSSAAAPEPQMPMYTAAELAAKLPAAKAEDVKSMDAILHAIHDVISGPAGGRDWGRFRSLFLPQARFTQTSPAESGGGTVVIAWDEEEFIRDASQVFSQEGFYENAIVNKTEMYGNIAQVFSSYESRRKLGEKVFQRGISGIQLIDDGQRWWVLPILWDSERAGSPLPAKFAYGLRLPGK